MTRSSGRHRAPRHTRRTLVPGLVRSLALLLLTVGSTAAWVLLVRSAVDAGHRARLGDRDDWRLVVGLSLAAAACLTASLLLLRCFGLLLGVPSTAGPRRTRSALAATLHAAPHEHPEGPGAPDCATNMKQGPVAFPSATKPLPLVRPSPRVE